MDWMKLRKGDRIIGGAWNKGRLPAPPVKLHLFDCFDSAGLAKALCGERQKHRSNGWAVYDEKNDYQRKLVESIETCERCQQVEGTLVCGPCFERFCFRCLGPPCECSHAESKPNKGTKKQQARRLKTEPGPSRSIRTMSGGLPTLGRKR